jgi:hypothetical protein
VRWYSLFANPFIHPAVMFRTSIVRDELGGFRKAYDLFAQDYDLWCRLLERHRGANLPDRLHRYRAHESSIMGFQAQSAAAAPRDPRFVPVMTELLERHATTLLGRALDPEERRLLPSLIIGITAEDLDRFLDMHGRMLREYIRREQLTPDEDFHRAVASQFDALMVRVSSRRAAWRICRHIVRHHPPVLPHLSWSRAAALLVLGRGGRAQAAAVARRVRARRLD